MVQLFSRYGTMPLRRRISSCPGEGRYDGLNHWAVSTELDSNGKFKRRNCKQCSNEGKPDNKTVLMCGNAWSCYITKKL